MQWGLFSDGVILWQHKWPEEASGQLNFEFPQSVLALTWIIFMIVHLWKLSGRFIMNDTDARRPVCRLIIQAAWSSDVVWKSG
jgi:hypothetical protein